MKPQGMMRLASMLLLIVLLLGSLAPAPVVQASALPAGGPPRSIQADFSCNNVSGISLAECQALQALYNTDNGQGWTNSTGWLASSTPCTWAGVTCENGHIATLNLYNNKLTGPIPPEIGNLTNLTSLILATNSLSGSIPPEMGKLTGLKIIYLAFNQLTGSIPPEIGNLVNLTNLVFQGNQLSGPIPAELGKLANLQSLLLYSNKLSGAIPAELGNLNKLATLNLSANLLSGDIPASLGTLTSLTNLFLAGNHLNIPGEPLLSQINSKTVNDVHWADYQGWPPPSPSPTFNCGSVTSIPGTECQALVAVFNATGGAGWTNKTGWLATNTPCTWFGVTCVGGHVTVLNLGGNKLIGQLPPETGNLAYLTNLTLYSNTLTGPIPPELGKLTALTNLLLAHNQFSGPIPADLGKLTDLTVLYLANNQLTGPIPPELGNLVNVKYFLLFGNQLSGGIPADLGNLFAVQNLSVGTNQLTGSIPQKVAQLPNLASADFSTNQFCGALPAELGTQTKLVDLKLSGNHFVIPGEPLLSQLNSKTPNDKAWTANQTAGECGSGNSLLALYVLAFDNNPLSTTNLTAYFPETMQSIAGATVGRTGVRAVVLADQSGPDNVAVYEISNGIVTQVTAGLPTLTESTVVSGSELGAFLQWARSAYPAGRTTLSYIGHNKPLPQEGLAASATLAPASVTTMGLFPLPIRDGAHPDYTDNTPLPEVLSVYDLGEALRLASQDGTQPLDLVDITSCFSLSLEETYALRSYTRTITGSPNYAFFEPGLSGDALRAINASMAPQQMAAAVVNAYDYQLPADGHPRILAALDTSKLDSIKEAWDAVSYYLYLGLNDPAQRESTKAKMAQAYQDSHKYDCTFCQPQDWALATPDALVDLRSFANQLSAQFGELSPVGIAAGDTTGYLNQAVFVRKIHNGIPWFGNPQIAWDFTDNGGVSLYADLVGRDDGQGHIVLNDIAPWYTRVQSSFNPHPYEFVLAGAYGKEIQSAGINWSDTFILYWKDTQGLITQLCLPSFPPIPEDGDLAAGSVIAPIANMARVGSAITPSATVSTTADVHNILVAITIVQNGQTVFTDSVDVPNLLAGTQVAVSASKPWTPTQTGPFTVRFVFDANDHVLETNEKNNVAEMTDMVRETPACPRPEIYAYPTNVQQWWATPTIQLNMMQTTGTATSTAAQVNRLVVEFFQYQSGVNPNTQVPVKVAQQTLTPISLPKTGFPVTLPSSIQPGVVVMTLWPRSDCGGLGIPRVVTVNYLPASVTLAANQQQFFTFQAAAGDQINLNLNLAQGSASMFVWAPDNAWSAQTISGSGTITINPAITGTYTVSVSALAAETVYTLTANRNSKILALQSPDTGGSPVTTVVKQKPDFAVPLLVAPKEFSLFLPIAKH